MDKPAPDAAKLLGYWEEWEKGETPPGKVLPNLKTDGMPELLRSLIEDASWAIRVTTRLRRLPGEADRRSSLVLPRPDSVDRHRGRGSTHRVAGRRSTTSSIALPPGATRSRLARSPTRHATRPCCVCSTRRTTVRMSS